MTRSTERFLTTHTGSLPRPDDLVRIMYAKEEGIPVDGAALAARIRSADASQTSSPRPATPPPPSMNITRVLAPTPLMLAKDAAVHL